MVCQGKTDGLKQFALRLVGILLPSVVFVLLPQTLPALEEGRLLTLKESIQMALERIPMNENDSYKCGYSCP